MITKQSGLWLLAVGVSAALNIYLLVTRPKTPQKPRAAPEATAAPRGDCRRRLAQCQRQRYISALQALQALQGRTQQPAPGQPGPRPTPSPSAAPPADVGPAEQRAALCRVAAEGLRKAWTASGEALTTSLRKSLADDADQERGMQREVKRFGDALDLTPADGDRLETHYRPLRAKRIAEALAGLQREPPDWKAVHAAAQALWQDQDRLTRELFGSDAVLKLRRAELRPRTTILALCAAQAGLDWEQAITW